MFSHLVESDLHSGELKRTSYFFLATLAAYALLLMAAGVVGVYAFEAHIDDQNLELVALVPPDMEEPAPRKVEPRPKPVESNAPANAGSQRNLSAPGRDPSSNVSTDPTKISSGAKTETKQTLPGLPEGTGPRREFALGGDPFGINGDRSGNSQSSGKGNGAGGIIDEEPPRVVKKQVEPKPKIPYIGPVNSRALVLPEPTYSPIARAAGAQGPVTVEIMIDETGRVISARATSGNPLLRQESERAALRARFSPTLLQNQPVKAKGVITFNFILRK